MKRLLVLGAVVFLVGCGAKSASQGPVNGQCGVEQNACVLGAPTNTGDTTSPYEWVCLGRGGGVNDHCSVPTAKVDPGEKFAGRANWRRRSRRRDP